MPTYEYNCGRCGKFETFQNISEDALSICPKCGEPVRRAISAGAGLIFKGSGFYITDYRNPDYKKKAKEDSGKHENPAQTKTADKPAAAGGAGADTGGKQAGGVDSKGSSGAQ